MATSDDSLFGAEHVLAYQQIHGAHGWHRRQAVVCTRR